MQLQIKEITTAHLPLVVELIRELAAFEDLIDYCEVTEQRLQAAMFGPGAVVEGLIAFDGAVPAGYALFYPNFSSFRGQLGLHLDDIYIKAQYRGTGLGEKMLKEIARIATGRHLERIDFHVLDWNQSAIGFYEKLGAVCNDGETHYKFAGEAFHALAS